jgi:hypothetical protein
VSFTSGAPVEFLPGAMAFAMPFDKSAPAITVMYDRIQLAAVRQTRMEQILLAHVLAHEIGHILLNSGAHTQSGIMKAYWSIADLYEMSKKPLAFTALDVEMIRQRLSQISTAAASKGTSPTRSASKHDF